MSASVPYVLIAEVAEEATVNAALQLLNLQMTVTLTMTDPATPQSTIDYWYLVDMGGTQDLVNILQAMCSGDLPQIEGQWGVNGVPEAADVQAAFGGGKVRVYSAAGVTYAPPFVAGVLSTAGAGDTPLFVIPQEL